MDPAEEGLMDEQPDRQQSLFTKQMAWRVLYQGIMIGVLTTVAFLFGTGALGTSPGSLEQGQTMAFAVLGFSQLSHSFNIHSPHASVFKTIFVNKRLIQAVLINALMMLIVLLDSTCSRNIQTCTFTYDGLGYYPDSNICSTCLCRSDEEAWDLTVKTN